MIDILAKIIFSNYLTTMNRTNSYDIIALKCHTFDKGKKSITHFQGK